MFTFLVEIISHSSKEHRDCLLLYLIYNQLRYFIFIILWMLLYSVIYIKKYQFAMIDGLFKLWLLYLVVWDMLFVTYYMPTSTYSNCTDFMSKYHHSRSIFWDNNFHNDCSITTHTLISTDIAYLSDWKHMHVESGVKTTYFEVQYYVQ